MVVVDVVLGVVAVADGDHTGHGHDRGQDHDLPQLPRDQGGNRGARTRGRSRI